ncbi:hypothetical protein DFA_03081 [Cavenderia fasciculata]|uniref:Uncharacterized protein n=1 Tax=Cavenderia fasciculata TaxID=261658 RepID=F4PGK2_CACFS|nr:uncharacterized protein DFA_03081 [Cavenderia fasciculata]EGG24836.1 hypothetical protein DFA_03081 [Cavenderia fasciculata]|eukprot:XP_004362687.1 hypothetical protein DFA_03081 [Cavenderia fasciculata]
MVKEGDLSRRVETRIKEVVVVDEEEDVEDVKEEDEHNIIFNVEDA